MPRLGKLELDAPFFQAALAGYSDGAMRTVAREQGCPLTASEALLDQLLIGGGKGRKKAELWEHDRPTIGQIIGSRPTEMAKAARILADMGYAVIDVNLACPVRKFRKHLRGGHLMLDPPMARDVLLAVRQAVDPAVPCTVKLRRGYDHSDESAADFRRVFEAAIEVGYAAATVHPRTVRQRYEGDSDWSFLGRLVAEYGHGSMQIFGSGDVFSAEAVAAMLRQTGVRAVAVARGAIGDPWIFARARALLAGQPQPPSPDVAEQARVLRRHYALSVACNGPRLASLLMRKFGIRYARLHPAGGAAAVAFRTVRSEQDWEAVLRDHYTAQAPADAAAGPQTLSSPP